MTFLWNFRKDKFHKNVMFFWGRRGYDVSVKRNMAKTLQYLFANDILVEIER